MFVVNPIPIIHRERMILIDADESIGGGTVKTRAVSKLFFNFEKSSRFWE